MALWSDLIARRLIEQSSDPILEALLDNDQVTAYAGFDPTAPSLHVGSLMPILGLRRLQLTGHRPIALVGGATGLIGDPSGKSEERKLLSRDEIKANAEGVRRQLERFIDFDGTRAAELVDNSDWFAEIGYLDFLRDVGKYFSVNAMLSKESVRERLSNRDQGISYTEFSYMLVQAYDFLHLFERFQCRVQIGGSDQWGNITAGIELIRRKRQQPAYGFTLPLITTADGKKFGKTESGNLWLDAVRTSPYQLFQYFLNVDDRDVDRFLRYFTFLPIASIEEIVKSSADDPGKRMAHRVLAHEVVTLVHGAAEAAQAEQAGSALFGGRSRPLSAETIRSAFTGAPSSTVTRAALDVGIPLARLLSDSEVKLCASVSAARRDIVGGGIYLNEERVQDADHSVTTAHLLDGQYLLLRKGKKSYHLLCVK